MQRFAVLPLVVGALVLVGCDRLLGITHVDPLPLDGPPPGPILLVQQYASSSPSAASLDVTLPAVPTNGDVLVMIGASDRASLEAPVGGGVTSWSYGAASNSNQNIEIWFGVTDGSSSTVSITCTCTPTMGNMRLEVTEWSGLDASRPLDTASAGPAATGAASPPVITTRDDPELLVLGVTVFGTVDSVPNGAGPWTSIGLLQVDSTRQSQWYQLVSPGNYMPAVAVSGPWDAAIVALRTAP